MNIQTLRLRIYFAGVCNEWRALGYCRRECRINPKGFVLLCANAVNNQKFGQHFLLTEWDQVVDAWQLQNWEAYRDVARLGRKTRLPEAQRKVLWSIFEHVRAGLKSRSLITYAELFTSLAAVISKMTNAVFDFAVVDEAQDITIAHVRFLAALAEAVPMRSSLRVTLVSAYFSSLSPGKRSVSMFGAAHAICASTIDLPPNSHPG